MPNTEQRLDAIESRLRSIESRLRSIESRLNSLDDGLKAVEDHIWMDSRGGFEPGYEHFVLTGSRQRDAS